MTPLARRRKAGERTNLKEINKLCFKQIMFDIPIGHPGEKVLYIDG